MPVQKSGSGYKYGDSGKVYPTREQAAAQGRAIAASGYYDDKPRKKKKKKNNHDIDKAARKKALSMISQNNQG
jgi:hypothetical protein